MASLNCYLRIYAPLLTSTGKPDTDALGHYDLQIDDSIEFGTNTTVENPVFSYGKINGKGYVKVFPDSKTTTFYSGKMLLCKWKFTASESNVASFGSKLKNLVTYQSTTNGIALYKVTSGPYQTYTDKKYNSCGATATWCKWLGNTKLNTIYNKYTDDYDGYKKYAAWKLFDDFYTYWQFATLT